MSKHHPYISMLDFEKVQSSPSKPRSNVSHQVKISHFVEKSDPLRGHGGISLHLTLLRCTALPRTTSKIANTPQAPHPSSRPHPPSCAQQAYPPCAPSPYHAPSTRHSATCASPASSPCGARASPGRRPRPKAPTRAAAARLPPAAVARAAPATSPAATRCCCPVPGSALTGMPIPRRCWRLTGTGLACRRRARAWAR